jgi:MoaA/NifB/PqqE/SkfB family radical SAM enzyme
MNLRNLIKTSFAVVEGNFLNKKIPLSVTFYITYNCNLRCKYCNVWNTPEREMTTEQIYMMMDELAKVGTQRFGFTGGEPLLRKDIGDLIEYSKNKNFITTLCTNGWLVPEKINELTNLDIMVLSLDGPQEIHDKYQRKGSYAKSIEAIKIAREKDIEVWTSTVLTRENINQLDFIFEKAQELDFKVCLQPVYNYLLSPDVSFLIPSVDDFRKTIANFIKLKKSNERLVYSTSFLEYLYKNWPNKGKYNDSLSKCLAGKFFCTISPSGNVYPCLSKNYKRPLNGLRVGFKKAFCSIKKFSCEGCYCDSFIESNLLFSFDFRALINALRVF